MKVLITGAKGQVGYCLTEQLKERPNITVLALGSSELDITDEAAVKLIVNDFKPSIIINAAAYTAVDKAETDIENAYAINANGPLYLAEAAYHVGAVILHISTDYVFSGDKNGLYTEKDLPAPQSIYGASKLAGEEAVLSINPQHIILRTAWVFGEVGNNFIKTMIRLGKERDTLSIVGDQYGGPTYAGDIAKTLISMALKIENNEPVKYGIYHYSGLPHVSWYEFADDIFDEAKKQGVLDKTPVLAAIRTEEYPTAAKRPSNSMLSTDKIEKVFGLAASDWQQALRNIKAYS